PTSKPRRDRVGRGSAVAAVPGVVSRSASRQIAFLVPHLRPGLTLLDCGCGSGAQTLELAALVTPGRVVGIDVDLSQIALARAAAAKRRITNVRFDVADVNAVAIPNGFVDAVFAHTVLQHLREPLRALREMYR